MASQKSESGFFRPIFHLFAAVQFWYSIYYHVNHVRFPDIIPAEFKEIVASALAFGGVFKYLTVLDVVIQSVYFSLAFLNDFIGTNEHFPKETPLIRRLKDYIFAALAFPLAFNVAVSFWGIYAIDRELILPAVIDQIFPTWLNHIYHTNIAICMLLEVFTSFRRFPSRSSCITGLATFLVAYLVWIHIIYYVSGYWVYPFLEVLSFPLRAIFFAANVLYCLLFYRLGEWLNEKVWENELKVGAYGKKFN